MNILHFKTTGKRIKDLMLSEDFEKGEISQFGLNRFVINFSNNVRVLVNLNKSYSTHYDLYPGSVHYNVLDEDLDTVEHGHTTESMKITPQFVYALWNMLNSRNSRTQGEVFVLRALDKWSRHINEGFSIIPLTSVEDILNRLK